MSAVILWSSFTYQEQNGFIHNSTAKGCLIMLLFHSFEPLYNPTPKDVTVFHTKAAKLIRHVSGSFQGINRAFKQDCPTVSPFSELNRREVVYSGCSGL